VPGRGGLRGGRGPPRTDSAARRTKTLICTITRHATSGLRVPATHGVGQGTIAAAARTC